MRLGVKREDGILEEDRLKRLKNLPAANDRHFVGVEEKQILERARLLANFIKNNEGVARSIIRKAKTKFGILGAPESWDPERYEKVDEFIDLSIFAAAQNDLLCGKSGNYSNPEDITKSLHIAMDRVAREMPLMIRR